MEAAVANAVSTGSVQTTLSGMINGCLVTGDLFPLASVTGAAVTKARPATKALGLTCLTASPTHTKVARNVHVITIVLFCVFVKSGFSVVFGLSLRVLFAARITQLGDYLLQMSWLV